MGIEAAVDMKANRLGLPLDGNLDIDEVPSSVSVALASAPRRVPFSVGILAYFDDGGWLMWIIGAVLLNLTVGMIIFPAHQDVWQWVTIELLLAVTTLLMFRGALQRALWGHRVITALTEGQPAVGEAAAFKLFDSESTGNSICRITYDYTVNGQTRSTPMTYRIPYQDTLAYRARMTMLVAPERPECAVVLPGQQPQCRSEETDFFRLDEQGKIHPAPRQGPFAAALLCLPILFTAGLLVATALQVYGWWVQR